MYKHFYILFELQTDSDTSSADWQSSRSSMGRWGRGRPVELRKGKLRCFCCIFNTYFSASALVNRVEGMSIQQPSRCKYFKQSEFYSEFMFIYFLAKGRGRGIVKKPNAQ